MQVNPIRHNSSIRLAALALLVVCLAEQRIRAHQPEGTAVSDADSPELDEVTVVFHTISWGMVRGQTSRISMVNPNEPQEREPRRTVFAQVVLFDAGGAVIAESDQIAIPPGESRSVDFDRDRLSLAGEPGTGRLQMRAQVRFRSFSIVDRSQLTVLPPSTELIDNSTGRTTAVWVTTGFFEVVPSPPRSPR